MERVLVNIMLLVASAAFCSQLSHANPIPDYYSAPGKSQDRSEAVTEMERIDPFSGSLNLSYVDIHLPGSNGFDININRIYRSLPGDPNLIGQPYLSGARTVSGLGWDIHMGRVWTHDNQPITGATCKSNNVSYEKSPVLELADGSRISLVDSKPGISDYDLIGRNNWIAKCRSAGGLEVYDSRGTKYSYHLWGMVGITDLEQSNQFAYLVTQIEDTYGNRIDIEYSDGSSNYKVIESVSANDGRRVVFSYSNPNSSTTLISSISAHGRTVQYDYQSVPSGNGKSFLSKATPPEGRSWIYQYKTSPGSGRYSISSVTSPTNLKSEYTFGTAEFDGDLFQKTTVVSKKVLRWGNNSADWIYSYSPAGANAPVLGSFPSNMKQDTTTIVGPYYCKKYTHIGNQAITKATTSGVSPYVYLIGTLTEKIQYKDKSCTHVLQRDQYEWDEVEISNQNNVQRRGLKVQEEYSFPVLKERRSTIDGDAYREEYSNFDVYGNPRRVESIGSKSKITNITYYNDPQRWIVGLPRKTTISSISGFTQNNYNSKGNLTQKSAYGVTTQYSYDGQGNLNSQTDPVGRVTRYENYSAGQPGKITYHDASTINSVINRFGEVESFTDQLNRTSRYTYDRLGRLKSIVTPRSGDADINLSYSYPATGIKRTLTRGQFTEHKTFDARGSLIDQTSEGVSLVYHYDLIGRMDREHVPNSNNYFTRLEYDALGRATKITHADDSFQKLEYLSNRTVKQTDENGRIRYQYYETFGSPDEKALKKSELPGGQRLQIVRNNLLQPTAYTYVTYAGEKTRNLIYDNKRFLIRETHPDYGDVLYTHYDDGQVHTKKTGFQPSIKYTYDNIGRIKNIDYPGSTPDENYQYDKAGNLTEVVKGDSTRRYTYDGGNNLTKETLLIQGGKNFSVEYGYNSNDALSYMIYPSGRRINLTPDDLGRPRSLSGFVSNIEYFPNGFLRKVDFNNGKQQVFTQTAKRLWPSRQSVAGVMNFDYAFDAKGNMKSMNSNLEPYPDLVMQYDSNDQLTSTSRGSETETFTYDYAHNITKNKRGSKDLSLFYSSSDWRLLSVNKGGINSDVGYDDYGHITSIGNDSQYAFDHDGHLRVYNNDTRYKYDGAGNRFLKVDPNRRREFFYSRSGLLLAEYDPNAQGGLEHVYLQKKRLASIVQCASDVDSDGDGMSDCKEILRGRNPNNNPNDASGGDGSDGNSSGDDSEGVDSSAQNLVANGTFDTDISDWVLLQGVAELSRETTVFPNGGLQFETAGTYAAVQTTVNVTPGVEYRLTVKMRSSAPGRNRLLVFNGGSSTQLVNNVGSGTDVNELEVLFTPSADFIRIVFDNSGASNTTNAIDDVYLTLANNSGGDSNGDDSGDQGNDNGGGNGGSSGGDSGGVCLAYPDYNHNNTMSGDILNPSNDWHCQRILQVDSPSQEVSYMCINPLQQTYRIEVRDRVTEEVLSTTPSEQLSSNPAVDETWNCRDIVPAQDGTRHLLCVSPGEDDFSVQTTEGNSCGDDSGGSCIAYPDYDHNSTMSGDISDPSNDWHCQSILPGDITAQEASYLCINPVQQTYQIEKRDRVTDEVLKTIPSEDLFSSSAVDESWDCKDIVPVQDSTRHLLCISPGEDDFSVQTTSSGNCGSGSDSGGDSSGGGNDGSGSGSQSNLIFNGTFDIDIQGWTLLQGNATLSRETTVFPNGGLQFETAGTYAAVQAIANVTPGEQYRLTVKMRSSTSDRIRLLVFNGDSNTQLTNRAGIGTDINGLEVFFTPTASTVRVVFDNIGSSTTTNAIDDIFLTPVVDDSGSGGDGSGGGDAGGGNDCLDFGPVPVGGRACDDAGNANPPGQNLLLNGTFDSDINGWILLQGTAALSRSTDVFFNGGLRFETAGTYAAVQTSVNVVAGSLYRLTANMRSSAPDRVRLLVFDGSNSTQLVNQRGTGILVNQIEATFRPSADFVRIVFDNKGASTTTNDIDNIYLTLVDENSGGNGSGGNTGGGNNDGCEDTVGTSASCKGDDGNGPVIIEAKSSQSRSKGEEG